MSEGTPEAAHGEQRFRRGAAPWPERAQTRSSGLSVRRKVSPRSRSGRGPCCLGTLGAACATACSTWPPSSVSALCGLLLGGGHSALPTPLCRHSGAGDGVPCVGPAETLHPGSPALCTPTARLWGAMHPGCSACPWVTGRCLPCPVRWPEVCDSGLVTQFHAKLVGPAPRCNRTLGVARPRGAARWWSWLPRSLVASVSLPLA